MKLLTVTLGCVVCAALLQRASAASGDLTIQLPIRYHLEKDRRTWLPQYPLTNGPVVTIEWTLQGDSIDSWKEMFDDKSILTKDSVRQHLDIWKSLLIRADPKAVVEEQKNADGGDVPAGNEMGISRYFQGSDGIYILSYRVRPKSQNAQILKIWREIIAAATLAPELLSMSERGANKTTSLDAAMTLQFHSVAHLRGASEFFR